MGVWRCDNALIRTYAYLMFAFLAALRVFFRSRVDTSLEVLALRQQMAVLKRKRPRPRLNRLDRLFWTTLRKLWPRWSNALVIVKPRRWCAGIGPGFASIGAGDEIPDAMRKSFPPDIRATCCRLRKPSKAPPTSRAELRF